MPMNFEDIPREEADKIKKRLIEQINSMNDTELRIVAKSESSLAKYIADAFQAFSKLLGYVIAYPIALAVKVAESMFKGFSDGWDRAIRDVGLD